jgi:hypothetical protein
VPRAETRYPDLDCAGKLTRAGSSRSYVFFVEIITKGQGDKGGRCPDGRFALSTPALLSAPSKKSFSSVSSPILACNDFTPTVGVAAPSAATRTKHLGGPFLKLRLPLRDLIGVDVKQLRQLGQRLSPLTAASAIFALKAGVWFRRARLLIVSPDSRAHLARRQAETPLIALFRFPRPALIFIKDCHGLRLPGGAPTAAQSCSSVFHRLYCR